MRLSASQRNISLMLSCPFPIYSSLTKMIHTCLDEGFSLPNTLNQSVVWSTFFPWWRGSMQSKCHHQSLQQRLPVLVSAFFLSCFITVIFVYFIWTCSLPFKTQGQRKIFPVSLSNNTACGECLITVQGSLSFYLKISHKPNKIKNQTLQQAV